MTTTMDTYKQLIEDSAKKVELLELEKAFMMEQVTTNNKAIEMIEARVVVINERIKKNREVLNHDE